MIIYSMIKTQSIITTLSRSSSGGFALLAAAGVTTNLAANLPLAPVLGGLGLMTAIGAGGMGLMAMSDCVGPFRCQSASSQCCLVLITTRGILCPASC